MCTFSVILSIVRSFNGGILTSEGSMIAVRSDCKGIKWGKMVRVRAEEEEDEEEDEEEEEVKVRKKVDRCKKDDDYPSVSPPKPRHPHKTDLFRMIMLGKASRTGKVTGTPS
jgi:hypothetical protein